LLLARENKWTMFNFSGKVLPETTRQAVTVLSQTAKLNQFYLGGGTAVAIRLGHRISQDLDFFSSETFDEDGVIRWLSEAGRFQLEKKDEQTILGIFEKTKLSFLGYPYPLLSATDTIAGMHIVSLDDLACMKLDAIASRSTKRDFIDLYCIIKHHRPLAELLQLFSKKYKKINYNLIHLKKSLVYFTDADLDPMPVMLDVDIKWQEVKDFFQQEVIVLI